MRLTNFKLNHLPYILISAGVVFWCAILTVKYISFGYFDWDLAINSNIMWNISRGWLDIPLIGQGNFLGNHVNIIAFLLIPLYRVISHPLVLIYLQCLSLLLSGLVVCYIAKKELGLAPAIVFAVLYLIYPPLWHGILYEFHFVALSVILLSLAYLCFYKNNFLYFSVFICLALLCREDVSPVVFGMGLCNLFSKCRLRWKVFPIFAGLLWAYVSFSVIGACVSATGRYSYSFLLDYLGAEPGQIIKKIVLDPFFAVRIIFFSGSEVLSVNMRYFIHLFAPLVFMPLLSLRIITILPLMLFNLLSINSGQHTIYYHYSLMMIPFIFISAIYGFKRFKDKMRPSAVVILLSVALFFNLSFLPFNNAFLVIDRFMKNRALKIKEDFLSRIPHDAVTVSTFGFLPELSGRRELYSLHTVITQKFPPKADYALIDFNDKYLVELFYTKDSSEALRAFLADKRMRAINNKGDIVLFEKGKEADFNLLYRVLEEPGADYPGRKAFLTIEGEIGLMGMDFSANKVRAGEAINIDFYWRCLKEASGEYQVMLMLFDSAGRNVYQAAHPLCYRIYPTQEWKKGQVIKESYSFPVPYIKPGEYFLKGFFINRFTKKIPYVESRDGDTVEKNILAQLSRIEVVN